MRWISWLDEQPLTYYEVLLHQVSYALSHPGMPNKTVQSISPYGQNSRTARRLQVWGLWETVDQYQFSFRSQTFNGNTTWRSLSGCRAWTIAQLPRACANHLHPFIKHAQFTSRFGATHNLRNTYRDIAAFKSLSLSSIFHGIRPLVDPFRSHASRSLFNGLPWFLLPIGKYCFITLSNVLRGIFSHGVSSFFSFLVVYQKLLLFLIPFQFVYLCCNLSKFIVFFSSCTVFLLLLFFWRPLL